MHDQDESVRHLVELGYVDPDEIAAREAARRRRLQTRFQQASDLHRQGGRHDAVALLETIVAEDPDWSAPHQLLAEIYYRAGNRSGAQDELDWLEQHGVDHPRLALIRAALALTRREVQAALVELQYAQQVEPNLPSVHTLLGTALLRLGRLDESVDAFREAVQQNPADGRARDGLSAALLRNGEYEEAADWALRSLEQDMHLFSAHYHLGVALTHLDRPNEAIAALEASARIDSSRAAPFYWLSRIAAEQLSDAARSARYRQMGREAIRRRRAPIAT